MLENTIDSVERDPFVENWRKFWKEAIPESGPELIVGLVAPLGVDLDGVRDALRASFGIFHYQFEYTVLSDWLKELSSALIGRAPTTQPEHKRIEDMQDIGNELRKRLQDPAAAASLACLEIRKRRIQRTGKWYAQSARRVYVVRSLKRPEELRKMRSVYGRGFLALAVYTPRKQRTEYLKRLDRDGAPASEVGQVVDRLLERDEFESEDEHVQDVRDTFYRADAFVDASDRDHLRGQIDRFVELIFGHPWRTPTTEEQAMMLADVARLRSAAPYRQVGAALVRKTGEIVGIGCNDVPRPGGGLYWEGDPDDKRDFQLGIDLSEEKKREALKEILEKLGEEKLLSVDVGTLTTGAKLAELMEALKSTRLANLIEFFRTTHAEMEAMASAARVGSEVRDSILCSTTFPCHECTRNIVAAGISRVIFVEPYPKSLAPDLFRDIISVDKSGASSNSIAFNPFVGIGPRLYGDVFDFRKRRDGTRLASRPLPEAKPRFGLYEPGSLVNEMLEAERLRQSLIEKGITTEDELKRLSPT